MSLNFDELKTPYQAFWRKLTPKRVLDYTRGWFFEEINSGYYI